MDAQEEEVKSGKNAPGVEARRVLSRDDFSDEDKADYDYLR
jgi:hypothetical protein